MDNFPHPILTRGLPSSGKLTWAEAWVQEVLITGMQLNLLRTYLRANPDVIVEVKDFDVPLDELLGRDAGRIAAGRRAGARNSQQGTRSARQSSLYI